jgi:hypothetical protein
MHRVFISYHHKNDQNYKNEFIHWGQAYRVFEDWSVDTGEIDPNLSDQSIRQKIRDEYLKSSTVTIVLIGAETYKRKHVDWEIYSSMYDGQVNKKSGLIGIYLPSCPERGRFGNFSLEEKQFLFPNSDHNNWTTISTKAEVDERHPYAPARLRENFLSNCYMPIVRWEDIQNDADRLEYLIGKAFEKRQSNEYDLSRSMMRRNL